MKLGAEFRRMKVKSFLILLAMLLVTASAEEPRIQVALNSDDPGSSRGILFRPEGEPLRFPVGFGRNGFDPAGATFRGGHSLLGTFRVNAILSRNRFEMDPELVETSGKSEAFLRDQLFANMSSIDFDGDGKGGEYGAAFISLEPIEKGAQPFRFNVYKGTFRWYSYAIHGTQDEARIGKMITGGCINVGAEDLKTIVENVRLRDLVELVSSATKSQNS